MCNISDTFQIIPLTDNVTEIHLFRFQYLFNLSERLFRLFANRKIQIIRTKSSRYYFLVMSSRDPEVMDRRRSELFFYCERLIRSLHQ